LGYVARPAFVPFHARKQRWACLVVHRRAGKTVSCVMDLIDGAARCKLPEGRFSYLSPTYAQSKDTAWSYLKRFTANIPGIEQRESDLMVVFPNAARVRLYGADNYDRLRGGYNDAIVLDEYGDIDPRAWPEVLRPSLADRNGRATFIGTPKGRNDFHRIYTEAVESAEWYSLVLKASQSGLLPPGELADMRRMLTADQYEQELECSFDAAIKGAIYRAELAELESSGRVCGVPYDPSVPVWTGWDLGIGDATAVWCAQLVGKEVHIIDYYENSGEPLAHYLQYLDRKPYRYHLDLLPHDAGARELGTGKTREEMLRANGRRVRVLPRQAVDDGINAAKMLMARCWFDRVTTRRGRECLAHYHREYNDKAGIFRDTPKHDWSSHCFAGETKVLTRHGMCRMMDLPDFGEVLTLCGWKHYRNPRITLRNAHLVGVVFTGGYTVRCTPDHLFLTESGWTSASDLQTGTVIQSTLTPLRSTLMAASTGCGLVRGILRRAAKGFIGMLGPLLLVPFQRGATSTIGMMSSQTTALLTWNAFLLQNIFPSRGAPGKEPRLRLESTSATPPEPRLPSGTGQMRGVFGTVGKLKSLSLGLSGSGQPSRALSAVSRLMPLFVSLVTKASTALQTARPLRIERVERLAERADAWDITVPGVEYFALENGAIVHNSADAFRTLAMGLRETTAEVVKIDSYRPRLVAGVGASTGWMGA
jgi:hypothetical protein